MWKDINWEEGTVHICRSVVYPEEKRKGMLNPGGKTVNAERTIPMIPLVQNVLMSEKRKSKSLYVFSMSDGAFLSDSSFRRMWELIYSKKRGIDFKVHPHQLRHTCATEWIASGMDPKTVQYLLGHASIDVTMEIYAHYQDETRRYETARKMEAGLPEYVSSL